MVKVHILRGLPGSGKTRLANIIKGEAYRDDVIVCSADHFFMKSGEYHFAPAKLGMAHAYCLRRFVGACQDALRRPGYYRDIIVDNTNLSVAEIAPYYAVAQAYGHEVEIVTVTCDRKIAFDRQTHGVPEGTFLRMEASLLRGNSEMMPWWNRREV